MACWFECCEAEGQEAERFVSIPTEFIGNKGGLPRDWVEDVVLGPASIADPSHRPEMFNATLSRPNATIQVGLDVERVQPLDILLIERVNSGSSTAAGAYNLHAPDGFRIQAGDYILSVNNVIGIEPMLDILGRKLEADVLVVRPVEVRVTVKKNGKPLGLELKYLKRPDTTLFVSEISKGDAVDESGVDLRAGDRIVKVNGLTSFADMAAELMKGDAVDIVVWRASTCVLPV